MHEPNEIIFQINDAMKLNYITNAGHAIKRLKPSDLDVFNKHLALCYPDREPSKSEINVDNWNRYYDEGTEYYCLFIDGKPVARCAVERYSQDRWEAADVRVAPEYRCKGYAKQVVWYVTSFILSQGKTATCRTTADNDAMLKVIHSLGYTKTEF